MPHGQWGPPHLDGYLHDARIAVGHGSRLDICVQELELLEAELQGATREPLSADPFLLYLYGLVLSDRFVNRQV